MKLNNHRKYSNIQILLKNVAGKFIVRPVAGHELNFRLSGIK